MLLSFRRATRWRYLRIVSLVAVLVVFVDLVSLHRAWNGPQQRDDRRAAPDDLPTERIFIASTHWNNEAILRSHWNDAVADLAQYLGPERVHVSVYESGSWDDSKGALNALEKRLGGLGIPHTFVLDPATHAQEIAKSPTGEGRIDTPRGKKELRRIPYLAKARNRSLQPLAELARKDIIFDKILFLNDVVFTTADVLNLLRTRDGDYAASCALDFSHASNFYDTFALRDSDGRKAISQTFPYFASGRSRDAVLSGLPVPVQSCWNGMAFFDAAPFYSTSPAHPAATDPAESTSLHAPLRFRGIPDTLASHHLEASECCLIHYDNPLDKGVYLNPHVRVGYNPAAYQAVNPPGAWPSFSEKYRGVWWNRLFRLQLAYQLRIEHFEVTRRLSAWGAEQTSQPTELSTIGERGAPCLINEMQVLAENGWAHV